MERAEFMDMFEAKYREARGLGFSHEDALNYTKEIPFVRGALSGRISAGDSVTGKAAVRGVIGALCKKLKAEYETAAVKPEGSPPDPVSSGHTNTATADYRAWCGNHNFVPADEILAHFVGLTGGAFSYARSALRAEGYTFDRVPGFGWRVVTRPVVIDRAALQAEADTILQRAQEIARLLNGGK